MSRKQTRHFTKPSYCLRHQDSTDPLKAIELVPMEPYNGNKRWGCPVPGCDTVQWYGSAPADQETRNLRHSCHKLFDPLWKGPSTQFKTRRNAYTWMSEVMGIPAEMCHIGYFSKGQCELLLKALTQPFQDHNGERLRQFLLTLPVPKV